jgi:hypothetical protein
MNNSEAATVRTTMVELCGVSSMVEGNAARVKSSKRIFG